MAELRTLNLKMLKNYADWKLLIFLILFLNVKLAIKIPAIALIYILQYDFKFGFRFKISRLPLFYPFAIGIAIINWVFTANYHHIDYALVMLTGIGFWLICFLASHQIKYAIEHQPTATIHHTLLLFFILNALCSLYNLAAIIRETGAANPYLYQGQYQKYFIGTGDFIRGISFDTSTTNALLNAIAVIYFFSRKNAAMVCMCMAILLLTGSNFINLTLALTFVWLFFFRSDKDQKSLIFICFAFVAVFTVKISPQNNIYAVETFKNTFFPVDRYAAYTAPPKQVLLKNRPDNLLTPDERKEKIAQLFIDSVSAVEFRKAHKNEIIQTPVAAPVKPKLELPIPDINTKPYQTRTDTDDTQRRLLGFIGQHYTKLPLSGQANYTGHIPGKLFGLLQTLLFLQHHPAKIFTGDGIGNFSSKLAFRTTGLGIEGSYPRKHIYISPDFLGNHLDVYLNFFSKRPGLHSLTNNPFSTYDQLLSEYGVLGLSAFLLGYLWFFARHYKFLTYGLPLLAIMIAAFFMDYWFEQLSVIVVFELLLFLDIKEHRPVQNIKEAAYE